MTRHRWTKLRPHVYVCRVCGTGRVNHYQGGGSEWIATWHLASGETQVGGPTPACEIGTRTEAALRKYAAEIAAAKPATRRKRTP